MSRCWRASGLAWSVAVPGGDVTTETGMTRLAIEAGGHVRIGLEDHASDNRRPSNKILIEEVVAIAREYG